MANTDSQPAATVLLVTDRTDHNHLTRSLLIQLGCRVILPNELSPEETEIAGTDLIVWDPNQTPLASLPVHKLMQRWREDRFIPLLVLLQDEGGADHVLTECQADDYLVSPPSPTALQARVRVLTQLKRMHGRLEYHSKQLLRRKAEVKKMTKAKAGFISIVSHELRTPLTPITAYTEMLLDDEFGPLESTQREALVVVLDKAVHMRRLIEDLLQFATLERGRGRMHMQGVALEGVLDQVAQATEQQYERKQISLERRWPATMPPVLADPSQIQEVVRHLLDNAYKFTPEGGHIVVRAYPELPKRATRRRKLEETFGVTVSVEDTGIGIPSEQQPCIFEHFYQADTSLTRTHEGMGLGLALAKRILAEHGAALKVESEEGQGSIFSFTLSALSGESSRQAKNGWGTH